MFISRPSYDKAVTVSNLFNLFRYQFPHLNNKDNITYFVVDLWIFMRYAQNISRAARNRASMQKKKNANCLAISKLSLSSAAASSSLFAFLWLLHNL